MRSDPARRSVLLALASTILAVVTLAGAEDDPASPEIRDEAQAPAASDEAPAPIQPVPTPFSPQIAPPADTTGTVPEPAAPLPATDSFPLPSGYVGRVEFWKNVFGVWTRQQVALHDTSFPGLVYEVLDLPAEPGSVVSEAFVRTRRENLEARLKRLEIMVSSGVPLTDEEKALALLVTTGAGTEAIAGASTRVRAQRGIRERFLRGLEISARYDAAFRKVFRDAGLPEDLAYLPHVESSFENVARSSAGAVGMWQFTRPAGRRFLTLTSSVDERLDPLAAARGAARYMKEAHDLLGSWPLAITSYNHGMGGMLRAKNRFGTDFDEIVRAYDGRAFGFASKNFYAEFLAAREIARDPAPFFPEGINPEPALFLDEVVLTSATSPKRLAQRYALKVSDLAALNPAWQSRAVRSDRPISAGVSVWLPGGTLEQLAAKAARKEQRTLAKRQAAQEPPAPTTTHASDASGLVEFAIHVVRSGESLFKIANRYGVTLNSLLDANRLTERSILQPGQKLKVPKIP